LWQPEFEFLKAFACSVHVCRFCHLFLQGEHLGRMDLLILDRWLRMQIWLISFDLELTLCVAWLAFPIYGSNLSFT
jgi:hypothetical protein